MLDQRRQRRDEKRRRKPILASRICVVGSANGLPLYRFALNGHFWFADGYGAGDQRASEANYMGPIPGREYVSDGESFWLAELTPADDSWVPVDPKTNARLDALYWEAASDLAKRYNKVGPYAEAAPPRKKQKRPAGRPARSQQSAPASAATEEWRASRTKLRHPSGAVVRSKSEFIIANLLDAAGLTWTYEQKLVGDDGRSVFPDFTIQRPDGTVVLWEHLGMMDIPSYAENWVEKETWYHGQGWRLGDNLFTTQELNGLDIAELQRTVELVVGAAGRRHSDRAAESSFGGVVPSWRAAPNDPDDVWEGIFD